MKKLILPYVSADYLLEKLTAYRESRGLTDLIQSYDKRKVNRSGALANKLLRTRYLPPEFVQEETRVRTHVLRAIYVQASFDLFAGAGTTSGFDVDISYSYIKIIPDDQNTYEKWEPHSA